jgi:hypothetical protein
MNVAASNSRNSAQQKCLDAITCLVGAAERWDNMAADLVM